MVRTLSERGGLGKLHPYWEKLVDRVVERIKEGPVYKIQAETGQKTIRVLHRNLLLPVNDLPVEDSIPGAPVKKRQVSERKSIEQNVDQEEQCSDEDEWYYPYLPASTVNHDHVEFPKSQTKKTHQLRAIANEFHPSSTTVLQPLTIQEDRTECEDQVVEDDTPVFGLEQLPLLSQELLARQNEQCKDVDGEEQETVRRSNKEAKPKEILTYDILGQPTYRQSHSNIVHAYMVPGSPVTYQVVNAVPWWQTIPVWTC